MFNYVETNTEVANTFKYNHTTIPITLLCFDVISIEFVATLQ
jgi:hypothetical protein